MFNINIFKQLIRSLKSCLILVNWNKNIKNVYKSSVNMHIGKGLGYILHLYNIDKNMIIVSKEK